MPAPLRQPAKRADHFEVTLGEGFQVIGSQGERGKKLRRRRARQQIIIPDDAEVSFAPLNADPVPETAVRAAADFPGAQELNEAILQPAANVLLELRWILVPALARLRADHEIALDDDSSAIQALQDRHSGIFPENVPAPIGQQHRPAAWYDHLQQLALGTIGQG